MVSYSLEMVLPPCGVHCAHEDAVMSKTASRSQAHHTEAVWHFGVDATLHGLADDFRGSMTSDKLYRRKVATRSIQCNEVSLKRRVHTSPV